MKLKPTVTLPTLALLMLGGVSALAADLQFDSLVKNSPFGVSPADGKNSGPDATPLEFRGFVIEGRDRIYSFYETASHRSFWLHENENTGQFTVGRFDESTGTIAVDYHGSALNLAIRHAPKIMGVGAAVAMNSPRMPLPSTNVATTASVEKEERNLQEARARIERIWAKQRQEEEDNLPRLEAEVQQHTAILLQKSSAGP